MFNECLELASVDAVLNLVNIDKFIKQIEDQQAAIEAQQAAKEEEEKNTVDVPVKEEK
jgi:hypothetical protein